MLKLIKTTVLDAAAASVTIDNIPQEFKTLKLVVTARTDSANLYENIKVSFNGTPSGTAYSDRIIYGQGSSAASTINVSQPNSWFQYANAATSTASTFSNFEILLPNYSSTSTNKVVSQDAVTENNGTQSFQGLAGSLWASTSAITSIVFTPNTGPNFVAGSTFYLYGIG